MGHFYEDIKKVTPEPEQESNVSRETSVITADDITELKNAFLEKIEMEMEKTKKELMEMYKTAGTPEPAENINDTNNPEKEEEKEG